MSIRKTGTVAVGSALMSLAGVAGAQQSPDPDAPPPPRQEQTTVEVEDLDPGEEVIVETRVRRAAPPAPPVVEERVEVVEEPPPPPMREAVVVDEDEEDEDKPPSVVGIGLTAGGGVNDFTGDTAQDFTSVGGAWDVRMIVGTRSFIAGEVAYIGTARDVEAIGLDGGAYLASHGGETAARLNFLPGMIQPYVFGGVGFTSYFVHNSDFNTSAVDENDTVAHFPVGGGLGVRLASFMLDGRGVFRPVVADDLFGEEAAMHTWEAKLSGGFEF